MQAYAAGDETVFREIFQRYGTIVTKIVSRDVRQSQDVPDLVQQVFLQLHRARHDFRSDALLRPWLFTIALNVKREYFRKMGRRRETTVESMPDPGREAPLPASHQQHIHQAVAQLPSAQREVIRLHWFDELSFPEIATVLGTRLTTVKVRAHRGYQRLRELLSKDEK